jgi:TetR/AcrR family transcriptional regulator, transcriptional repressor for nem operon
LETRTKLLDAAVAVFIKKGFTRSSVEEICRRAGTTKGAFFHYFESKDEVGLLALSRFADAFIGRISEHETDDPVRRVFEYLDRTIRIGSQIKPYPTCLVAVMTLELSASGSIHAAARESFTRWLGDLEKLISEAASARSIDLDARSTAEFFLSTLEGSLMLARACEDTGIIDRSVDAFKSYLLHTLTPRP